MGFLSGLLSRRPAKILVVEDAPDVSALIKDVLTLKGYEVTIANDGVQGLACFHKERFDLMILDHNMPRLDGAELLQIVRSEARGKKLAVIMLSGEKMLDPIYKAYDRGIIAWIPKPFSAAALLEKVAAQLKAARRF